MKRLAVLSPVVGLLLSFVVLTTPLAAAQGPATTLPGITVMGVGQASVPAETATIVLMLGSGDYYSEKPMTPPEEEPASSPAASAEQLASPVITALVDAGVPAADIELIGNPFTGDYGPYGGPTTLTLVFTLQDPDAERISALLLAAIDAATAGNMYVTMTGALYGVADCAPLNREARSAAIADAREQASLQADLLDVSLGDIVASRDDAYGAAAYSGMYGGYTQYNTCTLHGALDSTSVLYSVPAFDPAIEPTVTVSAHIELTFAIAP